MKSILSNAAGAMSAAMQAALASMLNTQIAVTERKMKGHGALNYKGILPRDLVLVDVRKIDTFHTAPAEKVKGEPIKVPTWGTHNLEIYTHRSRSKFHNDPSLITRKRECARRLGK